MGRLVAEALHFTFLDTDEVIQAWAGKSIREIFAHDGELVFRQWERKMVQDLAARQRTVISTGGGLSADAENLASLKTHSLVICLWASPEKIWERIRGQSNRPMLDQPNPQETIRQLLGERAPYYRQADVLLNSEFRSLREVAQQVIHQFHLAQAAHR